jgi:hypothetical protein
MSANNAKRNFRVLHLAAGLELADPTEARKRMLKQLADRLDEHHVFPKGQFVVWKAGLKNKSHPDYGEPAIVTGVYPTPIYDRTETAGSPYFKEPLSLAIGTHLEDDLVEFRVDGRRFEPIDG